MKKILALLLALMMALGCFGAFAEDTQSNEFTIDLPSFTVVWDSTVNMDALTAMLPMFGVDEYTMGMMQAIMPLLANTNGQLVFADGGVQLDIGVKGQTVVTLGAEQTEGGFALASDILPSYVLTISNETIESLMQQFSGEAEDAFANVDVEALTESLMGYMTEFSTVYGKAVTFGEAEVGEFVFEELELAFNCRVPVLVDMEAIKAGLETLIAKIKADENFASLFEAMDSMGVPVDLTEDPTFVMPEVTAYVYQNVDEEGNSVDGKTFVTVDTVAAEGDESVAVNVTVLVEGEAVTVTVAMPDQAIALTISVQPADDGAVISFCFEGQGLSAAEVLSISIGEALQLYSETYLMDMENPFAVNTLAIVEGGERTFTVVDENKAVLTVEQLMNDTEGTVLGALQADLMSNGLGNLIAKLSQIMPEEVANLMNLFIPAEAAE